MVGKLGFCDKKVADYGLKVNKVESFEDHYKGSKVKLPEELKNSSFYNVFEIMKDIKG